jgi:hypothetical protein
VNPAGCLWINVILTGFVDNADVALASSLTVRKDLIDLSGFKVLGTSIQQKLDRLDEAFLFAQAIESLVSLTFASWNRIGERLRRIDRLRQAA